MENIQMVDLISQYQDIKQEVLDEMSQVLDYAQFINGPVIKEFQSNLETFLNVNHVIPCANGTDAL